MRACCLRLPLPTVLRASLVAVALSAAITGCGGTGSSTRAIGVSEVPLPAGATITARVRSCDRGANAYCTEQLVVAGPRYPDSFALLVSERRRLKALGWSTYEGLTGKEVAEESPGHELRLTYATAYNDLLAVDMGWIRRTAPIGRALSRIVFTRTPAISLILQRGSS
jgi:hypothetical protein